MPGPLEGTRIVELAGIGPGPFCGMLLADLGAEVISIERKPPEGPAAQLTDNGLLRRGRRSVVVDLKDERGQDLVLRLLAGSEAFFEGMRPGAAERLGLGPERCHAVNPALVYGRVTGWGQEGPLSSLPGHDLNYISIAGALHAIGRDKPTPPMNLVADYGGGGMLMVLGILAGIMHARKTGEGQVVDAAMVDGAGLLMAFCWGLFDQGRWFDRRNDNTLDGGAPFNDVYLCADQRWIAVAAIEPQFRRRLLEVLEIPFEPEDLDIDPARWPRLREELTETFARRSRDEWVALLGGEEACVTPVLSLTEAREHPHHRARDSFLPIGGNGSLQPAPAPRFSGTKLPPPVDPPAIGADTDTVLAELGFGDDEVGALRAAGVVA